jgi:maltose phosphorylase
MGQRVKNSLFQGSYIAGIYYPDKTKVGWWKNGYPDICKSIERSNWIGIDIDV